MEDTSKRSYIRFINLEVGIPKDDIEAFVNSIKLEVLEDIITNVSEDDDTYDYVFDKYLNLKSASEVNDKSKENRNTE